MKYKLLEKYDLELMKDFIDDENTIYNISDLNNFINEPNAYGFIAKEDNKIKGFAFGYTLLKPDGKKDFIFMLSMLCLTVKEKVMVQD